MMCVARHIITIFAYQIRINLLKPTISAFQHSNTRNENLLLMFAQRFEMVGNNEGGTVYASCRATVISYINKQKSRFFAVLYT